MREVSEGLDVVDACRHHQGKEIRAGLRTELVVIEEPGLATDGKLLWRTQLGGRVANSPITYEANGRQQITVGSGDSLFTFRLEE